MSQPLSLGRSERPTAPQRRALEAARDGRLMVVYSWHGSGRGEAYIDGVSPLVKGNVRAATMAAVRDRGWLKVPATAPGRAVVAAEISETGLAALGQKREPEVTP